MNFWHRLARVNLLVPMWHVASDEHLPHISGLYQFRTARQFKADLEFFLGHYTPVSLQDVISHLDGVRELPKRCFLPTFDDGFREIYDVAAPILKAKGVPAVFFLITAAMDNRLLCYPQKKSLLLNELKSQSGSVAERKASEILIRAEISGVDVRSRIRGIYYRQRHLLDELAPILQCDFPAYLRSVQPYLTSSQTTDLLKMGFSIGAHSVDHPLYHELSLQEQLTQTRDSVNTLAARYDFTCQAFAFPYMDLGISRDFFRDVFADGTLKVTFGTGGMRHHFFSRNLSRFTMENTLLPAERIVADAFAKSILLPQDERQWVEVPPLGLPFVGAAS